MKKVFIALISGILMGLTPAPVEAWYLAWVALIPLWILIIITKKVREKLIISCAWGFGYHGLALFWITGIHPMTWMGVPWLASVAIAFFCWLFLTFWGAALVMVWGVGMSLFYPPQPPLCKGGSYPPQNPVKITPPLDKGGLGGVILRVIIGVAIWCGLEGLWSAGDLWWSSLSYTQSPHNLAILQLLKLSGPSTITAAIVGINGLIAEGCLLIYKNNLGKYLILNAILILIGLHLIGLWMYNRPINIMSNPPQPPEDRGELEWVTPPLTKGGQGGVTPPLSKGGQGGDKPIKVGIIQGNIPNEIKLYDEGWRKAIEGYTEGFYTLAKEGVEIILTPETALPFYWDELVNSNNSFYEAIKKTGVSAWVGAYGRKGSSYKNSLFTVTGTGETFSQYDKIKLVPLGEYIPFEKVLGKIIERLSPLDAHLARGEKNQVLDTPFGRVIVGICYESVFSQHFRRQAKLGGEFIITASNNAHYSDTMPAQHHAQDVMRAIETDRWAVRATNTGYSAIVDPHGRTIWISQINHYEIHADTIYGRETKTLYVRWGDWLTPVLLLLAVISGFLMRKKNPSPEMKPKNERSVKR